jgi:hypothetical protein
MITDIVHKRRIHDPWLDSFQDVQEEEAGCYAWVLERANRLRTSLAFLRRRIGPPEHLCVADRSALPGF